MLKRFALVLSMIAGISVSAFAASPASIELLSSTNATWTADVGNSTCTFAPRVSGDSIVATWKINTGTWGNTWVSIVATLAVSLSGADSIKILYSNNNADGYSLRLTQRDGTKWQSPLYLNGLVGLQAANFACNVTGFPQQKDSVTQADGVFNIDSIKTISFVNNTNPTTVTAAGTTGVYKIFSVLITKKTAAVNPSAHSFAGAKEIVQISSTGFFAPKAGVYSVSLYGLNGVLAHCVTSQFAAGFNKIDFSKFSSNAYVAKVSGNGFAASCRLVLGK